MTTQEVFISHIEEEADLAAHLQEMILADFGSKSAKRLIKVFQSSDISSIKAGETWLNSVLDALNRSKVLLVLCSSTSMQRPWVNFEIGAAWTRRVPIIPVCHSGMTIPDLTIPLCLQEAAELSSVDGIQKLYSGLARVLELDAAPKPSNLVERLERLKAIQRRLEPIGIQQYERYFDVIIPKNKVGLGDRIPEKARVQGNQSSLELLGFLDDKKLTWYALRSKLERDTKDKRWLNEIEDCILRAGRHEAFRPAQAVYHNYDKGSYQPQLAKKEINPDGSVRFHIHLVDTVVAPLVDVQNDFGLLVTLIRFALRLRYEVIEAFQDRTIGGKSWGKTLRALQEAIEIIESDAHSRGSEKVRNQRAILALFDLPPDRREINNVLEVWRESREILFTEPKPTQAGEVLKELKASNYSFMKISTRRFNQMVESRWTESAIAEPV